ncbi:hypothetical protein EXW57_27660 (plasmid) [Bacillus mycoides]|uniref:hypothetical protein n=1 Tax=Bacillus mycoides TaxID=1405 RepID=UPI001C0225BC|nr:hypothetical protein [Bacillus mycoides]QWI63519.1 hypothetical protein EXW57_27660 [Bacillus mycoides]
MNITVIFLFLPLLLSIHLSLREFNNVKKGNQINYLTLILASSAGLASIVGLLLTWAGIGR